LFIRKPRGSRRERVAVVPREVFQEIIHNGDGMLGGFAIGIFPQDFFEVARLAINEPLPQISDIVRITYERLRQYTGISASFVLAAGWSSRAWIARLKTAFVCHILWLLKIHG
jgi:hypothetical protein